MVKRNLAILLLFLSATVFSSADAPPAGAPTIKLTQIGVGNLYRSSAPFPVGVEISNPSDAAVSFELVIHIEGTRAFDWQTIASDYFRVPITIGSRETKTEVVPIIFRAVGYDFAQKPKLTVEAVSSQGTVLARVAAKTEDLRIPSARHVLYLLCDSRPGNCDRLQQAIAGNGTEEQINKKSTNLQLLTFSHLPASWWEYGPADFVIVGKSLADLPSEQRNSLAEFLFSGGTVVLSEDVAGAKDWLPEFRQGTPDALGRAVGDGMLFRMPSVGGPEMGTLFNHLVSDSIPNPYFDSIRRTTIDIPVDNFLRSNSERFDFPSARWLIIWLSGYILLSGPLSFFLLRKMRKLEWGWITVAGTALLFGILLYLLSSAKRPKQPSLDEVAIYSMDYRSPIASIRYDVQLSAPDRLQFTVVAPGQAKLQGLPIPSRASLASELPASITESDPRTETLSVNLGPTTQFPVQLLRWSTETLLWRDVRTLPGTVEFESAMLLNQTGVDFQNALYADWTSGDVYLLGRVTPGAKIDLNQRSHYTIASIVGERRAALRDAKDKLPFDIRDVLLEGHQDGQVFYGLSGGPVLGVRTDQNATRHRSSALFVVNMERP